MKANLENNVGVFVHSKDFGFVDQRQMINVLPVFAKGLLAGGVVMTLEEI